MKRFPLLCAALVAAGAAGCSDENAKVAFKAADISVVVNRRTPKTETGRRWYGIALSGLTNALSKVTGKVPCVYEEGTEPKASPALVYLGDTLAAESAKVADASLRNGDWRVKTVPSRAFLFGKTGMSSVYAVTEFVERYCGYLFLSPDGIDPFTFNPGLEIPQGDVVVRPEIYVRRIYTGTNNTRKFPTHSVKWYEYEARRRGNYTDEIEPEFRFSPAAGWCHTIHNYLPPEKYFKENPELYSMNAQGQRTAVRDSNSQICYTNPKTKKMVTEQLLRFIAEDRAKNPTNYPGFYDMTQMDNSSFMCLCPECKKVIAKYDREPGGHQQGGDAGLQLEFINDVAKTVRAKYPDVKLRVFAYVSSECPPKSGTIAVDPGVIIFWCDVYSRSDHTLPLKTDGHYNAKQVEEVTQWLSLTKNFHLWDYMLGTDDFPEVAVDAIAADAKFFRENALRYVFMETDYNSQPFFLLDSYVMSEFYLDPAADLDAAIGRFCRYYGKGAAKMREAIDFLRKIAKESPAKSEMEWHSRNLPWKNVRNMKKFLELAVRAHEDADDPVSRSRVAQTVASANKALMKLTKADPAAKSELIAAGKRYLEAMNEYIDNGFVEPSQVENRKRLAAEELEVATLKFADRPAELEGVSDDELVFIDYHAAPVGRRRVDPKSTTGRAMVATKPNENLKGGYPISCGMYDFHEKTSVAQGMKITAEMLPPDGEYHWIKVGRMRLGRVSSFWFPWSWSSLATLSDYYVVSDGAKSDPNRYDMWVSMRVAGPLFVKGSTEKDRIFLDRILLRRVKDEGTGK